MNSVARRVESWRDSPGAQRRSANRGRHDDERGTTLDAARGTAGGATFASALAALAAERDLDVAALATATGFDERSVADVLAGTRRVTPAELARYARAVKLNAIEFMQRTQLLSLEVYAGGLDPLYFLPEGMIRKDARIYMREINPRHRVPERDMFVRNPTLKALAADELIDALGKVELEFTYLLHAAVKQYGRNL